MTGSNGCSKAGWRAWLRQRKRRSEEREEVFWWALGALLLGTADAIWRPFQALLHLRNTERFKHLAQLKFDALCRELIEGKDFELRSTAREDELRKIANHISMQCASGAFDHYPQLVDVFSRNLFWVYLNGYAVAYHATGFAVGFYLGVGAAMLGVWLL
jgi:hypothetical protein